MKRYLLLPVIFFFYPFCALRAQSAAPELPPFTILPHYTVAVNFNTTTVLVFPAALNTKPVDRGDRDFIAQRQPGSENILKLKAARKGFAPTNLHVFSQDGRIYAFDIVYTDSLAATYDLTNFPGPKEGMYVSSRPLVQLSDQPINSSQLLAAADKIKSISKRVGHGPVDCENQMTLRLQRVAQLGPLLVLDLSISNHSNLDYHLDFTRLYIRDRQKAKRTSVQEREISPVYQDTSTFVAGKTAISHVLIVPAFTLANGKEALLEAYEKDGGRTLKLHIHNRVLFRATKLPF